MVGAYVQRADGKGLCWDLPGGPPMVWGQVSQGFVFRGLMEEGCDGAIEVDFWWYEV